MNKLRHFFHTVLGGVHSVVIVTLLIGVVFYFYFSRGSLSGEVLVWQFVVVTLVTDFLYIVLHLFRRPLKEKPVSFDPAKLSIVIACYNGEEIIGKTIENCLRHVPAQQIVIVSDASTDKTAEVAASYGVRVSVNRRNINKAFSVSSVMKHIQTDYVLVLDDDTLIGDIVIPTSLLDEGYSAVAFNVMPMPHRTVVNKLQQFEYRKSMFFGKSLRAKSGAIGNISGAIGLYKTSDLVTQIKRHSGQFGGEDQQRTALVHIYGSGLGVTYTDQVVLTEPPATPKALFRQRSFRWNLSLPELFSIYFRILVSPRHHYMLKVEKAYQIFLYTTDPFRVAFFWVTILYPKKLVVFYIFYTLLSTAIWLKLERKDPYWVVLLFPLYRQAEAVCRLIAHFYWLKIKYNYVFREKFHRYVSDRKVIIEYAGVVAVVCLIWTTSIIRSESKISLLMNSSGALAESAPDVIIDRRAAESLIDPYGAVSSEPEPQHSIAPVAASR